MALLLLPIWNFARLGTTSPIFRFTIDDDGPLVNVDFSTGRYCHVDCVAITNGAAAFKDALKTALDAASSGAGVYTVTFDQTTLKYTISYSAGNFDMAFPATPAGALAKQILGFTSNKTGAASYISDVRVYYAILCFGKAKSNDTDEYDDDDGTRVEPAADALSVYSISPLAVGKLQEWDVQFEEHVPVTSSPVFKRGDTAAFPFSWQDLFELRNVEPFLFMDDASVANSLHYLTQDGVDFKQTNRGRAWMNYQKKWHITLRTYLLGRL